MLRASRIVRRTVRVTSDNKKRRCIMVRSCLLLLLGLLLTTSLVRAAERPPLIIGYYDFPPSVYTDSAGKPQGDMIELARRIALRAGYEPIFRGLPSARLYGALIDGSVDIWPGASGKPELVPHIRAGDALVSSVQLNLYFRPDTLLPRIPQDLSGNGVIVINGYNYAPPARAVLDAPGVRLHQASTHASALRMLLHERGDFLLDYELPIDQARRQLRIDPLPFVVLHRMPIKFIASLRSPRGLEALPKLDAVVNEMTARGESFGLMHR